MFTKQNNTKQKVYKHVIFIKHENVQTSYVYKTKVYKHVMFTKQNTNQKVYKHVMFTKQNKTKCLQTS